MPGLFVAFVCTLLPYQVPARTLRARVEPPLRAWFEKTRAVGLVAGVLDRGEREVFTFGTSEHRAGRRAKSRPAPRPLDGDSLFEIGSISKVFTCVLLARLVAEEKLALSDPVAMLLPDSASVPRFERRRITLLDLATHSSSLPRMPNNLRPRDPLDPYATYGAGELYAFLRAAKLRRAIGSRYEYSNLGVGLLGHALGRKVGSGYEAAVTKLVCEPLGLSDTRITLDAKQRARFAGPHAMNGFRVKPWHFDALAGAGALRSSVNDLLRFAAANLGLIEVEPPLDEALALARARKRRAAGGPWLGLGWHLGRWGKDETALVRHNGMTGGYSSLLVLLVSEKRALVCLSNSQVGYGDLGQRVLHALDAR